MWFLLLLQKHQGTLTIYSADPFAFSKEEVELLEILANDLSFGIQALRTEIEHQKALVTLKSEVEKNIVLLRNSSDGIHICDYDGNNIEVSDSFCLMLGYTRDELIGMNVSKWDANMSYDELMVKIRGQIAQKKRVQFQTRHRRKDGSVSTLKLVHSRLN